MCIRDSGNILLKVKRRNLPRPEKSSWPSLFLAIAAVIIAIIGNAILNPAYLTVFFEYFIPTILLIIIMLNRTVLLKFILKLIKYFLTPVQQVLEKSNNDILQIIDKINSQEFVYFTKDDTISTLNKVMLYIQHNEHTKKLRIVRALNKGERVAEQFVSDLDVLDREYPEIKIDFIQLEDDFGPELIKRLSKEWNLSLIHISEPTRPY